MLLGTMFHCLANVLEVSSVAYCLLLVSVTCQQNVYHTRHAMCLSESDNMSHIGNISLYNWVPHARNTSIISWSILLQIEYKNKRTTTTMVFALIITNSGQSEGCQSHLKCNTIKRASHINYLRYNVLQMQPSQDRPHNTTLVIVIGSARR